jgi:acyl carrier protein
MGANNNDVVEVRRLVDEILTTRHEDLRRVVRESVAAVMAIDVNSVSENASIVSLGAESIDLLDLVFRLETAFGVNIPRGGIEQLARVGLGDNFERRGVLTADALARLDILMPEADRTRIAPGLRVGEISELFTVETFVRLLAWRLADART